ncbi:unnamed protein product [Ceutorhynchus assimilis]|uniref:Major facilitator superfamily (MFS) profile domain-containing protein n=1 Tax=Ceutorhynchus assimilis TaxID=467358 RepID=A0A9N9MN04_9CUCU|nr:unnamed protein product [Ceutorhynchus assimilis]
MKYKGCNPLKCLCGCFTTPQRVMLALILHLALQNSYNLRTVMNVAIVEMVEPANNTDQKIECPQYEYVEKKREGGQYPWPRAAEARILYAFFGGYFVSHLPTGYLADTYGARHVLGISMILGCASSFIIPICIQKGGEWAAISLRFFLGVTQGGILPCISSLVSHWIPEKERPFLGSLAYSGSTLGPILTYALTGVIIEQTNNWTMPFYVWSSVTVFYLIFHYLNLFSYPQTHPFITEEELNYLDEAIVVKKRKKIPWKGILLNVPFWANVAGHSGHNYLFYSLVTFMPVYMREILRFNIEINGLVSALPFVGLWSGCLGIGALANYVINKGLITRYNFGRIFGTMGQWGCSLVALGAVYIGCHRVAVVSMFVLAMFIKSLYYMTMTNNINELSLNYGGIMFAINNGLNSLTGVAGGEIIGAITKHKSLAEWRIVLWISVGYAVATSIIYILWSSADRQKFDFDEEELAAQQAAAA